MNSRGFLAVSLSVLDALSCSFVQVHSHQTEALSMRSARSHLTAVSRSIRGGSYSSQR
jgi:hypothetical protein